MSKEKLTRRLGKQSAFAEIDQAFSECVLRLETRGYNPANICFIGSSNLAEYGYARCPSGTAVCAMLLGGLLHQIEKRFASEDAEEGEEDFPGSDWIN
jgi:hypothetical protein